MSRPGELMMPTFEIRPGRGVGPVELGMTISEAISALQRELGQRIDPSEIYLGADRTRARLPPERAVHLLLDRDQAVEAIELAGPPPDSQMLGHEPPFSVLYGGMDVFPDSRPRAG